MHKHFFPRHTIKEEVPDNLQQAWIKAAEVKTEDVVLSDSRPSILSQDTELFSSAGFQAMVDEVIRKALEKKDEEMAE